MTVRQTILSILTLLVLLFSAGPALIGSLEEAQITDRLELYQTDMMLQASEVTLTVNDDQLVPVQSALIGKAPIESGLEAYQTARKTTETTLSELRRQAKQLRETIRVEPTENGETSTTSAQAAKQAEDLQKLRQVTRQIQEQRQLSEQLILNIGVLQAAQAQTEEAIQTWTGLFPKSLLLDSALSQTDDGSLKSSALKHAVETQAKTIGQPDTNATTAVVLAGLWADPPEVASEAESIIRQQLTGWFRDRSLTRLYNVQQDTAALTALQQAQQSMAQQTVQKLAVLSAGPVLGCLIGVGLIIFLIVQRVISGQTAILADAQAQTWETPWNWEITWQVIIVGFFIAGQFVVPILFQVFKLLVAPLSVSLTAALGLVAGRANALSTLVVYGLMSAATIGVLVVSIRDYKPLAQGWFRVKLAEKWWLWGLGGYVVAIPLVIGVSVVNQSIWQGRGGSNPLLQIVLEEGDGVALGIFFFTAAIAAPIFEEILFRGFLLPSLTRYMSTWGAIALSSVLFAAAHLSVSEILPLAVLGMVLGFVYTRSKNLLAPMMVHSLWNSATMLGLLVLGSSV